MIDAVFINHWHCVPSPNGIEVTFKRGEKYTEHRNVTGSDLGRLMEVLWPHIVSGEMSCTPSFAPTKNHMTYHIQRS
jgi:hypothetical protein